MVFTEANTVESLIVDLLCGPQPAIGRLRARRSRRRTSPLGRSQRGTGWHYVAPAFLPRQPQDVFVDSYVREALIRLNPAIAAQPDRADEVLYKLRAIVLSVRCDGLIKANEEFTAWLRGDRSMPFGPNHEHVTVRLIDFDDLDDNQYVVTTQYTFRAGPAERRADLVLLVNGFPLVMVEAKTPVRDAVSWFDGAMQIHDDYERFVPELFAANVFSVATEGKELRYGAIHMPLELWGPWRDPTRTQLPPTPALVGSRAGALQSPAAAERRSSTSWPTSPSSPPTRRSAASRSSAATSSTRPPTRSWSACWPAAPKKGLIWHFPGLGQVAADGLRRAEAAPAAGPAQPDRADRRRPHRPGHPDQRHLPRLRHPQPGQGRIARGAGAAAAPGHAQDHHHDHLQVRRGRRRAQRPGRTSSSWWTRRTAPRKATWA